jgi:aldehyde:ferredoxin oxidoreductase
LGVIFKNGYYFLLNMPPRYSLLRVDLRNRSFRVEYFDYSTVIRRFLGGRGLGAYLALKEIPKGIDPLGPENKLYMLTGPLTGVVPIASSRMTFVAKSPLTGSYTHSKMAGNFAYWLRKSGYDGVVLEGKADEPIYISIVNGTVEFHDARHMWGKDALETEVMIRREMKCTGENDCGVITIGPAGENLVRFASIMGSFTQRAAGRGGLGAVMGSKLIKGVFVKGNRDLLAEAFDRKKLLEIGVRVSGRIAKGSGKDPLHKFGTSVLVNIINSVGALPTRNFETGIMPTAEKFSGEVLAEKFLVKRHGCALCPIACTKIGKASWGDKSSGNIKYEYESLFALGSNLGVDDPNAILSMIDACNRYGLDTISTGNTLATATELSQKGLFPEKITWGDANTYMKLIEDIAFRRGIGNELAEGAYYLSVKYKDPESFVGTRGQGFPAYDPRALKGFVIAYATANRGGDHNEAWPAMIELGPYPFGPYPNKVFDPLGEVEEKIVFTVWEQNYYAVYDSLVLCNFVDQVGDDSLRPEEIVELLNAYAGWNLTYEELITIGERIFNTERLFHVKEGRWVRDELPPKILKKPMPDGPAKGHTAEKFFEWGIKKYYELRGWVDGKPTRDTLRKLGLEEFEYLL